jgi:rod shape-determining protein MreC
MFFKKRFLIFVVFILFIFSLLTYQSIKGEIRIFELSLYPLRILEQISSAVIKGIRDVFKSYILIVGKEYENRRLIEEINRFKQERNKYIEAKYENERLRRLLELKSKRANYVTAAEVFARDPTNWFQVLWINKGRDDGISRDMIAVTHLGPVGRIHRVFNNRANIILITDVNSSVAVRIQSSRIEGILEGRGDNRCYLKYVPQEAEVKVGERVITSGLDGIYPEGLLIGYVTDVEKKSGELFQLIEVAPAQDLNAVEEVVILKR